MRYWLALLNPVFTFHPEVEKIALYVSEDSKIKEMFSWKKVFSFHLKQNSFRGAFLGKEEGGGVHRYLDTTIVFLWDGGRGGGRGMFCRGELSRYNENDVSRGCERDSRCERDILKKKKC